MRILFICGSLELGKDGVGDYTRRLAALLTKKGHQCFLLGVMDKFVSSTEIENQVEDSIKVKSLRLPYQNGYKNNFLEAKSWLHEIEPDWVSLQYVPFSFNSKGLAPYLSKYFFELIHPYRVHVMFHELWVGMNTESSFKLKIWGKAQKLLIKSFVKSTSPRVISTQSSLYLFWLEQMGIRANLLPLISNIPKTLNNNVRDNLNVLRFVVFGNIHYGAPVKEFAKDLQLYLAEFDKSAEIHFIGKCGSEVDIWMIEFTACGFETKIWGMQDVATISKLMSNCDFGIVATPSLLIEKSGSFAALKEHGLPIVVLSRPWTVRQYKLQPQTEGIFHYTKSDNLQVFLNKFLNKRTESFTYDIANKFLDLLKMYG
jgi:hypothetical protein